MEKNSNNTPTFNEHELVKVAGQNGKVARTLDDGRIVVEFDNGQRQPIEPDKVERA